MTATETRVWNALANLVYNFLGNKNWQLPRDCGGASNQSARTRK